MYEVVVVIVFIIIMWMLIKGSSSDSRNRKNETRVCNNCGMRIPYNARTCPYCLRKPGVDLSAEGRLFTHSFDFKLLKLFAAIMAFLMVILIAFFAISLLFSDFGENNSDSTEVSTTEEDTNYTYYEAEASDNTLSGEATISSSYGSSGKKKVGYIGNGASNTLTFNNIEMAESGSYELVIYYLNP